MYTLDGWHLALLQAAKCSEGASKTTYWPPKAHLPDLEKTDPAPSCIPLPTPALLAPITPLLCCKKMETLGGYAKSIGQVSTGPALTQP